jgi:AcrR family transcriptional regulator
MSSWRTPGALPLVSPSEGHRLGGTSARGYRFGLMPPRREVPAGEQLLRAAVIQFRRRGLEGINTSELQRLAGVSQMTLPRAFGSKRELQRAAVERWSQEWRAALARELSGRGPHGRDPILRVFDVLARWLREDGYLGSFVTNALATAPDREDLRAVAATHQRELLALFTELTAEAGVRDPQTVADELLVLVDGALTAATQQRITRPVHIAKQLAARLLAAHTRPTG